MKTATFDQYGVRKVADSDPEEFVIFFANTQMPDHGPFMREIDPMNEVDARAELANMGLTPTKIEELIAKARTSSPR